MVEINGKKVRVEPLKFRDFMRFSGLVLSIVQDAEKGELKLGKYFEQALPLMASMTGIKEEEIEELPAKEGLKLLRACAEVILEDEDFFRELNETLKTLTESLSRKR